MKTLNKNQLIAVFASLAFLAYLLFSGPMMNLFNPTAENTVAQTPENGFLAQDVVVGDGVLAETGDTISVHYVGTLEDSRVFDSSRDRNTPFRFTLGTGQVIRGWDEGLVGMRVGGKRILIISPEFGYGGQGVGTIPPNSVLQFEVELLDAEKSASR